MLLSLSISSTSFPSSTSPLFPSLTSFPHLCHSPPLPSFFSDYLTSISLFPLLSSHSFLPFIHLSSIIFFPAPELPQPLPSALNFLIEATELIGSYENAFFQVLYYIILILLLFFLYTSISLSFSRFYRSSNDYYYQFGITSFSLSFYHSSCLKYFYFLHISPSVSLFVSLFLVVYISPSVSCSVLHRLTSI